MSTIEENPRRGRWAYAIQLKPRSAPVLFIGTMDEAEAYAQANGSGWSYTGVPSVSEQITDATPTGVVAGVRPARGRDLCFAFCGARLP